MTSYSNNEQGLCLNVDILRFLPPCRCNRNENGDQKSIDINGTRRLFVSSQCIKSSIRKFFGFKVISDISYIEDKLNNYSEDMDDESYNLTEKDFNKLIGNKKTKTNSSKSSKKEKTKTSNYESVDEIKENTNSEEGVGSDKVCVHTSLKEIYKMRQNNVSNNIINLIPNMECLLFGRMYAQNENLNTESIAQVSPAVSVQKTEFEDETS